MVVEVLLVQVQEIVRNGPQVEVGELVVVVIVKAWIELEQTFTEESVAKARKVLNDTIGSRRW